MIYYLTSVLSLALLNSVQCWNILSEVTRDAYPQVIGHAGSSGYLPESTLEGYDLAAYLLSDYSEPDLVMTKDSHFVALHDLTLEGTTNVESFPEYADRVSTFIIEGEAKTGYYAINFTLSEIKSLRVRQRFDGRSKLYDWKFEVPTLQEIMQWQINYYNVSKRLVGIYPEIKHPDWHNSIGYPMEDVLIQILNEYGYHTNDDKTPIDLSKVIPVVIQCFKNSSLKYLKTITNIPLVQLMGISNEQPDTSKVYTEAALDDIMTYASAVGPDKKLFTSDWGVSVQQAIQMRRWAFDRNLYFVPWSFQEETKYIPDQFNGDAILEMQYFYGCLQSSGIFHEFPDQARNIVSQCGSEKSCFSLCPYV